MIADKTAILLNPSAGKGKALKKRRAIEQTLRKFEVPFELFVTQNEDDLKSVARECLGKFQTVVGAGGDSTFNIILNEVYPLDRNVRLGIIGIGSSNDIAREFDLLTLTKACLALKKNKVRKLDLGCIVQDGKPIRYFLGQANAGLGVYVNRYVQKAGQKVPFLKKAQSLMGGLGAWNAYKSEAIPVPLSVTARKEKYEGRFICALFSNIRFWATGRIVCPNAKCDDGLLDAFLIQDTSIWRIWRIANLTKRGTHENFKEVKAIQSPEYEVSSEEGFNIQTDGEILGHSSEPRNYKKINFKIVPQEISVVTLDCP